MAFVSSPWMSSTNQKAPLPLPPLEGVKGCKANFGTTWDPRPFPPDSHPRWCLALFKMRKKEAPLDVFTNPSHLPPLRGGIGRHYWDPRTIPFFLLEAKNAQQYHSRKAHMCVCTHPPPPLTDSNPIPPILNTTFFPPEGKNTVMQNPLFFERNGDWQDFPSPKRKQGGNRSENNRNVKKKKMRLCSH